MKARLDVVSYKNRPPESPISAEIGEEGGTIGRSASCTCTLPDPERFISGRHAEISYQSGRFYITDTSTNGLYFNGDINPLGRDNRVVLSNGHKLVLGDYIVQVDIVDDLPDVTASPFEQKGQPAADGFFEPAEPEKPATHDDFFQAPPETSPPPWQSESSAPRQPSDNFFASPAGEEQLLDQQKPATGNDFFTADGELTGAAQHPDFHGAPEADNVASDNQFFSAPNSIPEDWDILSDAVADAATEAAPASAAQQAPLQPEQPLQPPQQVQAESAVTEQAPTEPPAQSFAIPSPGAAHPRMVSKPGVASANSSGSVQSFLDGAGVSSLPVPSGQEEQFMQAAGTLMRESLQGLMLMLRARAEVKSEFRMQQTTIRAVENNPLKFSVSVEDALQHMLSHTNSAYLPPMEAMQEAMQDLEAHQLATMAGVQAALSAMLKRFEPEQLQQKFDQKSGRSLLESKKSWYWQQYEESYRQILSEAEDNFQELFGEEFIKAYQQQIERLATGRNSQK